MVSNSKYVSCPKGEWTPAIVLISAVFLGAISNATAQELKTPNRSYPLPDSPQVHGPAFPSEKSLRGPAFPHAAPPAETLPTRRLKSPDGYHPAGQLDAHISGKVLKIGGGGFLTGIDIKCDTTCGNGSGTSTKVVRTDTYGGYYLNPNATPCGNTPIPGCWQQVITSTSINNATYMVLYGQAFKPTEELRIAPSNTSHFYAVYAPNNGPSAASPALFLSSTNRGTNWTISGSFSGSNWTNYPAAARYFGPTIAIDPANENVVFVGSPTAGVQYTADAGNTFASVTGLSGGNGSGVDQIAFDPSSGTSDGKTVGAYECRQGTGIYHTSNANAAAASQTWTETTTRNMPTSCAHMVVDQNGVVWVIDGAESGTVYIYKSSAWTKVTSGLSNGAISIAVDPYNANAVYVLNPGGILYYTFAGSSTTSFTILQNSAQSPYIGNGGTRIATDIPWLAVANEGYMTSSDLAIDPAQTQWTTSTTSNTIASSGTVTFTVAASNFGNYAIGTVITVYETSAPANVMQGTVASGSSGTTLVLSLTDSSGSGTHTDWTIGTTAVYMGEGIGVWYSHPTISSNVLFHWTSQTAGIEQLVAWSGTSPWGSSACSSLGTSTSVPIVANEDRAFFAITNPNLYPTFYGPNLAGMQQISAGWNADWAGNSPQNLVGSAPQGYKSTQGIYVSSNCGYSWTSTGTPPADVQGYQSGGSNYPVVGISATTTNDMTISQYQNGDYYTTNGGTSWHTMTYPGVPNRWLCRRRFWF